MTINDQNTKTNETNVALFESRKKTNSHPHPSRDAMVSACILYTVHAQNPS